MNNRTLVENYVLLCTILSFFLWIGAEVTSDIFWFVPNTMSGIGFVIMYMICGFHFLGSIGIGFVLFRLFQSTIK